LTNNIYYIKIEFPNTSIRKMASDLFILYDLLHTKNWKNKIYYYTFICLCARYLTLFYFMEFEKCLRSATCNITMYLLLLFCISKMVKLPVVNAFIQERTLSYTENFKIRRDIFSVFVVGCLTAKVLEKLVCVLYDTLYSYTNDTCVYVNLF
jgi:hypothetical protein